MDVFIYLYYVYLIVLCYTSVCNCLDEKERVQDSHATGINFHNKYRTDPNRDSSLSTKAQYNNLKMRHHRKIVNHQKSVPQEWSSVSSGNRQSISSRTITEGTQKKPFTHLDGDRLMPIDGRNSQIQRKQKQRENHGSQSSRDGRRQSKFVSHRRDPYYHWQPKFSNTKQHSKVSEQNAGGSSRLKSQNMKPRSAKQTSTIGTLNQSPHHALDKSPFIQKTNSKKRNKKKASRKDKPKKPNILLIMTDDLDIELGSLNYMPRLLRLLGDEGAMFSNSYTSTPMCCPSRSSMLTGMYIHNHEIYTNSQNCSSSFWQNGHEKRSFASYLNKAGYRTGYFGKYLNRYNGSHVPAGWREWAGLVGNSRYYNYTVNRNSRFVKYGNRYPQDYYPHIVTSDGLHFLKTNKKMANNTPFLLVLSYPAPHGPEDSAPEHSHRFFHSSDHHTASYNYAPNPDKQWILQFTDRMTDLQLKFTDLLMTKRLQTLQTIDESVEKIINELKELDELDNTYVFFTSDHGYHLGQFGLSKGKSMPFEFDIKIPFLVRGPGVKAGAQIPEISLNIDLAPTFLDIAGVRPPRHMDGRSLLPLMLASSANNEERSVPWRDTFLVESSGRLREEEELQKLVQRTWQREKALSLSLQHASNGLIFDGQDGDTPLYTSKHERFQEVCEGNELRAPCSKTQKWFCVKNGNRWRLKKCRPKQSLWRKRCICQSPFGLGTFRRLDPRERRRQRNFLKRNVNKNIHSFDPKFLHAFNNIQISSSWDSKKKHRRLKSKKKRKSTKKRFGRSVDSYNIEQDHGELALSEFDSSLLESQTVSPGNNTKRETQDDHFAATEGTYSEKGGLASIDLNFDDDLTDDNIHAFIEEEELRDLQDQIFDISDELQSLENVSNIPDHNFKLDTTSLTAVDSSAIEQCKFEGNQTCDHSTEENLHFWRNSKAALEGHMQRLKQQLAVIKNIYSHLQSRRPNLDLLHLESEDVTKDYVYEDDNFPDGQLDYKVSTHNEGNESHGGKLNTPSKPTYVPEWKFENEALIVSPDEHSDDQLTLLHIKSESSLELDETRFKMTVPPHHKYGKQNLPNTKFRANPTKYLDSTISMSNGHHLYPIPLSFLLDELMISENESTEPLCWCDKRVLRRLELQKARSERRQERKLLKQDRLRRKFHRKQRKKQKFKGCHYNALHCYAHDNSHWRTPPLWTDGYFCFCMSASNNTYWCLRTINEKHNFLYCEFITGLITYYDLHIDPYQLRNVAFTLSNDRVVQLHNKLTRLRICSGSDSCHEADQFSKKSAPEKKVITKHRGHHSTKKKINSTSVSETRNDVVTTSSYNQKKHKKKIKKMKRLQEKLRRRLRKEKKAARKHKYASLLGLSDASLLPESFAVTGSKARFTRKSRHGKSKSKHHKRKKRRQHKRKLRKSKKKHRR